MDRSTRCADGQEYYVSSVLGADVYEKGEACIREMLSK